MCSSMTALITPETTWDKERLLRPWPARRPTSPQRSPPPRPWRRWPCTATSANSARAAAAWRPPCPRNTATRHRQTLDTAPRSQHKLADFYRARASLRLFGFVSFFLSHEKEVSVLSLAFSFSLALAVSQNGRLLRFFLVFFLFTYLHLKKRKKYWKQKDMGPPSCTNVRKYIFRL